MNELIAFAHKYKRKYGRTLIVIGMEIYTCQGTPVSIAGCDGVPLVLVQYSDDAVMWADMSSMELKELPQ